MVDLMKMTCSPFADTEASDSLRGGLQNSLTSLCYVCLFIYIMMKTNFMRTCGGRMKGLSAAFGWDYCGFCSAYLAYDKGRCVTQIALFGI
jgi:hypothetical protein